MILKQQDAVERALGTDVICYLCGATLATYEGACSAQFGWRCPGFIRIETVQRAVQETE